MHRKRAKHAQYQSCHTKYTLTFGIQKKGEGASVTYHSIYLRGMIYFLQLQLKFKHT